MPHPTIGPRVDDRLISLYPHFGREERPESEDRPLPYEGTGCHKDEPDDEYRPSPPTQLRRTQACSTEPAEQAPDDREGNNDLAPRFRRVPPRLRPLRSRIAPSPTANRPNRAQKPMSDPGCWYGGVTTNPGLTDRVADTELPTIVAWKCTGAVNAHEHVGVCLVSASRPISAST